MAKKVSLNLSLLAAIVLASAEGASPGYMYVSDADAKPLLAAGYVEQNPTPDAVNAAGERQTRALKAGIDFLAANPPKEAAAAGAPAAVKEKPVFALGTVDIPEIKRGGGEKTSVYPFDDLGVKGNTEGKPNSFFVPATDARKEPAKALASTVSGATRRHTVQQGMKADPKDPSKQVPNMVQQRKFVIRAVADGAPWGDQFKGVAGAAIYRQS